MVRLVTIKLFPRRKADSGDKSFTWTQSFFSFEFRLLALYAQFMAPFSVKNLLFTFQGDELKLLKSFSALPNWDRFCRVGILPIQKKNKQTYILAYKHTFYLPNFYSC